MSNYPPAESVPWVYNGGHGPAYFRNGCQPAAVVLHIMAGYAHTARDWANSGYSAASWHYTVARDGSVMEHLALTDGGYQAGVADTAKRPTWSLWRGPGINVNSYTLGIEHEGFPGEPFTPEQAAASKALCRWLADTCGFPFDREHFPPHAEIDVVNRVNDFNLPALREEHYAYLFSEEDDMTPEQVEEIVTKVVGRDFPEYLEGYFSGGFTERPNAEGIARFLEAAAAGIRKGVPAP
jgi:hypothetical protein